MPEPTVRRHSLPPGPVRGALRVTRAVALRLALWVALVAALLAGAVPAARAQGVELATLKAQREEGALVLEFAARVSLPRGVEDALGKGVPVYFVAEATLRRSRWYWRDERIARVSRSWRVAFQPLTGTWRVGLGGLNQNFATLGEALLAASRSAGWKLADLNQLDPDKSYYVDFTYRLDTTQLPSPMQFGLAAGQGEWNVGVARTLRLE
jgi:hypothetical protein